MTTPQPDATRPEPTDPHDGPQERTQALADGALLVHRTPGRVDLVFNRPQRHNAFTSAVYDALVATCADLAEDDSTRVVVLRGAGGKAFAAGNEISEFSDLPDGAAGVAYEARVRSVLQGIAQLPQVTVAAVEGICVGGGLAVATHCDLRIATDTARFGLPIARTLGNAVSASLVYRCAAVFGESLTREMLLASRLIGADRAYAVGAVMAVVPQDRLAAEVDHVADGIRLAAPLTLRTTKRQLLKLDDRLHSRPDGDDDDLARVYGSTDFTEGVRAFLAKERPRFGAGG